MKDINAVIEIPRGSRNKYEIKNGVLTLDRTVNQAYPFNYGYIPNTLEADGDALDVFVISDPIVPMARAQIQVIGGFRCLDAGVSDDKLIAVLTNSEYSIRGATAEIRRFLDTYKEDFKVTGIIGLSAAVGLIRLSRETFKRRKK